MLVVVLSWCLSLSARNYGLDVVKVYVGGFTTSLEMAGVSLTLLSVEHSSWLECLGRQLHYSYMLHVSTVYYMYI